MAANEKTVYASDWTSHGGKLYRPGEQLSGRMPDHAITGALEGGVATDSHAAAQTAARAESDRRARVEREIETRSERREADKQHGQRVVQMPDGSFRLAE